MPSIPYDPLTPDRSGFSIGKEHLLKSQLARASIFALIILGATVRAQTNPAETEIRATRQSSNEALKHHDIQAFAASLDADFVMIRGNGVLVPSRQAYIDTFAQDFANPKAIGFQRIPDKIEISTAAPLAAEHGHWIGTRSDASRAYSGTYLAMWRKTQSGWKLRSELYVVLTCEDPAACAAYRKP
jgi:ketosteroid isomerase-like protein